MKIKEIGSTKLLFHCSWRKHEACPDRKTTEEQLKKAAAIFEVKGITSGVCEKCFEILNAELDREEEKARLLALKNNLKNPHG